MHAVVCVCVCVHVGLLYYKGRTEEEESGGGVLVESLYKGTWLFNAPGAF